MDVKATLKTDKQILHFLNLSFQKAEKVLEHYKIHSPCHFVFHTLKCMLDHSNTLGKTWPFILELKQQISQVPIES